MSLSRWWLKLVGLGKILISHSFSSICHFGQETINVWFHLRMVCILCRHLKDDHLSPFSHTHSLTIKFLHHLFFTGKKKEFQGSRLRCSSSFYADGIYNFHWTDENDLLKTVCVNRKIMWFYTFYQKGQCWETWRFSGFACLSIIDF